MNKNELCREILNVREILEVKLAEKFATLEGLDINKKKELVAMSKTEIQNMFDVIVDRVLESD